VPSPDSVFVRLAKPVRRVGGRTTYYLSAPIRVSSLLPARLTQEGIEVLGRSAEGTARLTQEGIEVLGQSAEATARLTQEGIEVLGRSDEANARLTQEGIEVLAPVGGVIPDRPANDLFVNSETLTGSSDCITGTNWNEAQALPYGGATIEAGDPLAYRLHNYGDGTVWYVWTAPSNGYLTVTTGPPSSGTPIGDSVIGVYTGSVIATLVEIDYNDDYAGNPYAKLYNVPVTSGTVYHIEITGFDDDDFGAFELCWEFTTSPIDTVVAVSFDFELHQ
jgi:hypothetical protein